MGLFNYRGYIYNFTESGVELLLDEGTLVQFENVSELYQYIDSLVDSVSKCKKPQYYFVYRIYKKTEDRYSNYMYYKENRRFSYGASDIMKLGYGDALNLVSEFRDREDDYLYYIDKYV